MYTPEIECMLHIRYDWRRPVFWAALCLTFFLSSQTNSTVLDNGYSNEFVIEKPGAGQLVFNEVELRKYGDGFPGYFYITKR